MLFYVQFGEIGNRARLIVLRFNPSAHARLQFLHILKIQHGMANLPIVSDVSIDRFNRDVCEREASNFTLYYHDKIHVRVSLKFSHLNKKR